MPAVPKEVQRQADELAEQLWSGIAKDASRSDADPVQLERIKPMVLQALRTAFGRGALISVKIGLEVLEKALERQPPKGRN